MTVHFIEMLDSSLKFITHSDAPVAYGDSPPFDGGGESSPSAPRVAVDRDWPDFTGGGESSPSAPRVAVDCDWPDDTGGGESSPSIADAISAGILCECLCGGFCADGRYELSVSGCQVSRRTLRALSSLANAVNSHPQAERAHANRLASINEGLEEGMSLDVETLN